MERFPKPLWVEYWGDGRWVLVAEFEYHTDDDIILIPKGFTTDFASVPRIFWNLFSPTDRYGKAAVLHDFLYNFGGQTFSKRRYTKAEADDIFRDAMKYLGINILKRNLMWSLVKIFGRGNF